MSKIILILSCLMVFTASQSYAANAPVKKEAPAKTESAAVEEAAATPPVVNEDLKHLIETLESETARTEFLGNLKTLLEQQEKGKEETAAEGEVLPLTEQIGVRGFINDSVTTYEGFLSRHNLSGSIVNQTLGSIIVIAVAGFLFFLESKAIRKLRNAADRLSTFVGVSNKGLRLYVRIVNVAFAFIICLLGLFTLGKIWGIQLVDDIFENEAVRSVMPTLVTVLLIMFLAALLWQAISLYLTYILRKADSNNQTRAKTLLPIVRNIIVVVFAVLFGLVLLSELGINVTPLLAGAGVMGVAVGFGAQSIVKDYLAGFTIIFEDLVRVGDVVNMAGVSGSVEKITLRKIQIRDYAGSVYTIPYSEIKVIQNLTKDFSFYVMDISVAYDASIDKVIGVLRSVDEDLRKDENFGFMILEPLEIAGVDKFADSAIVIKARIKTAPIRQWAVGREFNKRMKLAFDKSGIEIPFPQRTVNIRNASDVEGLAQAVLEEVSE